MDLQNPLLLFEENTAEEELKKISRKKIIKSLRGPDIRKVSKSGRIQYLAEDLLRECFIYQRDLEKSFLEEVKKNPRYPHDDETHKSFIHKAIRLVSHLSKVGICDVNYKEARARWYPDQKLIAKEESAIRQRWRDEEIAYRKWLGRTPKEECQKAKAAGKKPWLEDLEMEDRLRLRKKLP